LHFYLKMLATADDLNNIYYENHNLFINHHLNKKIFLWKKPSESLPYYEEIIALDPIIINENIEEIR